MKLFNRHFQVQGSAILAGCFLPFLLLLVFGTGEVRGQSWDGSDSSPRDSGYFFETGIDLLPSSADGSATTARMVVVNGHRFNPHFSAGIGLGYTPYNDPMTLLPLFFDLNYRVSADRVSAMMFLRAGFNFSVQHEDEILIESHSGGLMLNPGAGLYIPLQDHTALKVHAGYSLDRTTFRLESSPVQTISNEITYKRLSVGLGIVF